MISDPGNLLFTLIPHCNSRGSVGLPMKLTRICVLSLGCVAGAFAFGVVANAAIDRLMPRDGASLAPPVVANTEQPAFALASVTSTPVDLGPAKVKTLDILVRDGQFVEPNDAVTEVTPSRIPLPRPRPANAPGGDSTASIAHQAGSLAIAAATRKASPEDGEILSLAGIDRMKMALALTADQEEFWPAIAAELRAIGKALPKNVGKNGVPVNVDKQTMERLYWAAAPLITRLSYEQKLKVKQMARLMGLTQVAEAL
jgi:hypothetical protein